MHILSLGLVIICAWDYVNILMQDHYFFFMLVYFGHFAESPLWWKMVVAET